MMQTDQLQSATLLMLTDSQQSAIRAAAEATFRNYSAFGYRTNDLTKSIQTGFNGEHQDQTLGVYWLGNGYRIYNPLTQRFNSPDSKSPFLSGGINTYAYCSGDPINYSDPTGHIRLKKLPRSVKRGRIEKTPASTRPTGVWTKRYQALQKVEADFNALKSDPVLRSRYIDSPMPSPTGAPSPKIEEGFSYLKSKFEFDQHGLPTTDTPYYTNKGGHVKIEARQFDLIADYYHQSSFNTALSESARENQFIRSGHTQIRKMLYINKHVPNFNPTSTLAGASN